MRIRKRQLRAFRLDDVQTGEAGHVVFHASIFGNQDSYQTIFDRGAFRKTINDHGGLFPVCWFHAPWEPIALGLHSEDETGLRVEADLDLDVELGRRVYSGMKKGYIDCASHSFDTISEYTQDGIVHFSEVALFETSPLTRGFASNPIALVDEVRARTGVQYPVPPVQAIAPADLDALLSRIMNGAESLEGEALTTATVTVRSLLDVLESRGANGATGLPLASRGRAWDAAAAKGRVREWAGAEDAPNAKYARAFFWHVGDAVPSTFGEFKLPFADVVDGELTAVPKGIFAAAGAVNGAMGGVDIPEADVAGVKRRIESYYAKMAEQFGDDGIVAPWRSTEPTPLVVSTGLLREAQDLAAALSSRGPIRSPSGGSRTPSIAPDQFHALLPDLRALRESISGGRRS